MRRQPDSFAAAVRAFRELTAAGDEAAATRARVLAAAERTSRGYASPRRISLPTVAGLLVICTASVAGTTVAKRWARPLAIALVDSAPPASPRSRDGYRAVVVVPTAPPADEDGYASGPSDAEAAAYGRAHRAHFADSQPARALEDWDDYLRRYPRGAFVPEARYNRALCLARLRRFDEAERALLPLSEGRLGGYRQAEADQLLAWLRERPPAP
jgi:tetratricopeptide (TPR) repeat protein